MLLFYQELYLTQPNVSQGRSLHFSIIGNHDDHTFQLNQLGFD